MGRFGWRVCLAVSEIKCYVAPLRERSTIEEESRDRMQEDFACESEIVEKLHTELDALSDRRDSDRG